MEINVTPEDVDALVKDALLKAGIGKAITAAAAKIFSGYDNPVDKELKAYISEIAARLLREKFAAQILEAVTANIEEKVTKELITNVVNVSVDKMVRAASDRY